MNGRVSSRFRLLRLYAAALALAGLPLAAAAQGAHSLQGRVLMPNNNPPNVAVKVTLTFDGRRVHETFTDLSGRFSFSGLRRGMYQLTAESDGKTFETTTVYAEVAAFGSAPQTFTQNIALRPRSGAAVPEAGVVSADAADLAIPEPARKLYEKGVKRAADNQPEKAIQHFREALSLHPAYYQAQVAMAEQHVKLQEFEAAARLFQAAIEQRPNRPEAHVGFGMMMVRQKNYAEAIAPLRRAVELDRMTAAPFMFLGLAEMMTGDYEPAETHLRRALEIDKAPAVHIYLANLYELRGEPARAVEHLRAFLKASPSHPQAPQIREAIEKLRKQEKGKS